MELKLSTPKILSLGLSRSNVNVSPSYILACLSAKSLALTLILYVPDSFKCILAKLIPLLLVNLYSGVNFFPVFLLMTLIFTLEASKLPSIIFTSATTSLL